MKTTISQPGIAKYFAIAEELRGQIRSGTLASGQRLPSYASYKVRGLSQTTVEKAYGLLEADGLIKRAVGSGVYVAGPGAPSRVGTNVIGIPGWEESSAQSPYYAPLLQGVQEAAHTAGYDVLLTRDLSIERLAKMDGVLWVGPNWKEAKASLPEGLPWVSLLWEVPEVPSVTLDVAAGIRAATAHLLELGHRRIGYLFVEWSDRDRLAAYRGTLESAGILPHPQWVRPVHPGSGFNQDWGFAGHGYHAMQQWLNEDWRELGCTAVLAHNDEAAVGVLRALREASVSVPQDVSVIGFDGTIVASHAEVPLTTIEVPLREAGALSVELLLQLIRDETTKALTEDTRKVLPVRLRVSASTAPVHHQAGK